MKEFKVIITKTAQKDLNGLDPRIKLRILKIMKCLGSYPFPKGNIIKRLKGARIPLFRLRIGNFRVVYHIDRNKVIILYVVDRKDLEKKLKSML